MSDALGFPVSQWVVDGLALFGGAVAIVVAGLVVLALFGIKFTWRRR